MSVELAGSENLPNVYIKQISLYDNVPDEYYIGIDSMSRYRGSFVHVKHAEVFKVDTLLYC